MERRRGVKINLDGAFLGDCDLAGIDLSGASLVKTDLHRARLDNACFFKSDLTDADLTGATCKKTNFTEADFRRAKLSGIAFSGDLSTADFSYARMKGCSFPDAIISGAVFTATRLQNATFDGAVVNDPGWPKQMAAELFEDDDFDIEYLAQYHWELKPLEDSPSNFKVHQHDPIK